MAGSKRNLLTDEFSDGLLEAPEHLNLPIPTPQTHLALEAKSHKERNTT